MSLPATPSRRPENEPQFRPISPLFPLRVYLYMYGSVRGAFYFLLHFFLIPRRRQRRQPY